jgi:hypothetical protein
MSQTPTYWRRVKLRLIDSASAYADLLEQCEQADLESGRALSTAYTRYNWDLFEIGPRNVAAIVERDIGRGGGSQSPEAFASKEALVSAAKAFAKAQVHFNHPSRERREIWGAANDRYDQALEALGPRRVAEIVQRDLQASSPSTAPIKRVAGPALDHAQTDLEPEDEPGPEHPMG